MKPYTPLLLIGIICLTTSVLSAQNAPISTIESVETYNDSAIVSITVANFTNIGACQLVMNYDSTVAKATSITLGPGVGHYYFLTDVDTLGRIKMTWLFFQYGVPGLSLPDGTVFLNIAFERTNYGFTAIEFDNSVSNNCLFTDENYDELNDDPDSTYYIDGSLYFKMIDAPGTSAPFLEACEGLSVVEIPVSVTDFSQIGAFKLTMQYNASVFSFLSFTNVSGFPDLAVVENTPGTIVAEGSSISPDGVTMANNSVLFSIQLENLGGSTALNWLDLGESCEYRGPAPMYEPRNDVPQSAFYMNGYFTGLQVPEPAGIITGPPGGSVCKGDSNIVFTISPLAFATGYEWEFPEGAMIQTGAGTHEVGVCFGDNAIGGDVLVYGINECGNGMVSPSFELVIDIAPSIDLQPVTPDSVNAGSGTAHFSVAASGSDLSYQWQEFTGDWANLEEDEIYSGVYTTLLTITNPSIYMNGNKYRCIVSGSCGPPAISDGDATLWVVLSTGFEEWNSAESDGNQSLKFNSFPNPFSDQITFAYTTPSRGTIHITISDLYGAKVAYMNDHIESRGYHTLFFNANQLTPGIYIASITFNNETMTITDQLITVSLNY
jgi:hypothetical protein